MWRLEEHADWRQLNQSMHSTGGQPGGGGSDYIFCDGSARFLRARESVLPLNRWAVTPAWRTIGVPTAPSGG